MQQNSIWFLIEYVKMSVKKTFQEIFEISNTLITYVTLYHCHGPTVNYGSRRNLCSGVRNGGKSIKKKLY